jgi:chemotaxis protein MotB
LEEERESKGKEPIWLTSFMDVLFILIAFFALYLSFTTIYYPPEISIFFRTGSIFEGSNRTKIELPDISPHLAETVIKKKLTREGVEVGKGKEGEIVLVFPENILFGKGEYQIKGSIPSLDKLAEILKKLPNGTKVIVVGHTDSLPVKIGSNWELSTRRAISVVEYLIRKGVKKEMLRAVGVADTQPLVEEVDEVSRALNRRVEVKIYLPKVLLAEEKE